MNEQYDIDMEEQILRQWEQFEQYEEENKPLAKVVDFSIVYNDPQVKAIIIEKGE